MEEKVTTRYVFMMLLALSDRHGEVIGTDIAIARMMNVPKDDFCESLKPLLEPDPDSNSPAEEGRRVIASESGRGYKIVNYTAYRDIKSDDEKREYMRQYMRQRRQKDKESVENVNPVNPCKTLLNDVTHTEAEADTEVKAKKDNIFAIADRLYSIYPKKVGKDAALKAIKKALTKIDAKTLEQIVMEYAQSQKGEDMQFIPNPATWFNQGRWQDDRSTWKRENKQMSFGVKPLSRDDRHQNELKEEIDISTLPVWDATKDL